MKHIILSLFIVSFSTVWAMQQPISDDILINCNNKSIYDRENKIKKTAISINYAGKDLCISDNDLMSLDFSSQSFCSVYKNIVLGVSFPKETYEVLALCKIKQTLPAFAPKINIKLGMYFLSIKDEKSAMQHFHESLKSSDGFEYANLLLDNDDCFIDENIDTEGSESKKQTISQKVIDDTIDRLKLFFTSLK